MDIELIKQPVSKAGRLKPLLQLKFIKNFWGKLDKKEAHDAEYS